MTDAIEFDPVDSLSAGAFGRPGQRTFLIQARKDGAVLSVLVEKEQVALLAAEVEQFLDRLEEEYPAQAGDLAEPAVAAPVEEAVPLFRARMIGIGYDPDRRLVLLELRERPDVSTEEEEPLPEDDDLGSHVARLYATRGQVRSMVVLGAEAVAGGRPRCPLCDFPMDPDGHICPRWN